jgi:hypothetical protein
MSDVLDMGDLMVAKARDLLQLSCAFQQIRWRRNEIVSLREGWQALALVPEGSVRWLEAGRVAERLPERDGDAIQEDLAEDEEALDRVMGVQR